MAISEHVTLIMRLNKLITDFYFRAPQAYQTIKARKSEGNFGAASTLRDPCRLINVKRISRKAQQNWKYAPRRNSAANLVLKYLYSNVYCYEYQTFVIFNLTESLKWKHLYLVKIKFLRAHLRERFLLTTKLFRSGISKKLHPIKS